PHRHGTHARASRGVGGARGARAGPHAGATAARAFAGTRLRARGPCVIHRVVMGRLDPPPSSRTHPRPRASCPALCRASTSYFPDRRKTWMAGTSPAMTSEELIVIGVVRKQHGGTSHA